MEELDKALAIAKTVAITLSWQSWKSRFSTGQHQNWLILKEPIFKDITYQMTFCQSFPKLDS